MPPSGIINGGFEQGDFGWTQYDTYGLQIISEAADLPVPPHAGAWAAWLGGVPNDASILEQQVQLPSGALQLTYWIWIASEDYCNVDYDIAGVLVNDEAVDAYILCEDNNTNGWLRRVVNLAAFAGQSVTLDIAAFTDGSFNSSLFVDDVSVAGSRQDRGLATASFSVLVLAPVKPLSGQQPGAMPPAVEQDRKRELLQNAVEK